MLHGVLIANEIMEEAKRCKKPCLVFKVDYEKAYDSLSWKFLIYMMSRLGFCPQMATMDHRMPPFSLHICFC